MPKILCLIDGHALAYRAYYALTLAHSHTGRWTTSKGEATAGVFGFASVLLRILEQEYIDYLAVAFDTGRTFRHALYPQYKGTRAKMPDDLRPQIERIRQLVDTFNIPRLELENYEADDVLGSSATHAVQNGLGVKIFTGDRDLLQLVSERIIVNLPGKTLSDSRDYHPQDVLSTLGVRPDQVVDMKALMGDSSDNIPGVPGVGQKTTLALLKEYDNLENVYAHLEDIKPATRQKLEVGKDLAFLSRSLATIVTDLEIPIDLERARPHHFEAEPLEALFRELEFRTLLKRLYNWMGIKDRDTTQQLAFFEDRSAASAVVGKGNPASLVDVGEDVQLGFLPQSTVDAHQPTKVILVQSQTELRELGERCKTARFIVFDTETTGIEPMRADLVGISIALAQGEGYYLPIHHQPTSLGQAQNLSLEVVLNTLRPSFTDAHIPKWGHNLKFDYIMLARRDLKVTPLGFDSMLAEWLVNPDSHNLGLKKLAWVRMNRKMTEIETLIGKGKQKRTIDDVPLEDVAAYAVADVDAVARLYPLLQKELLSSQAQQTLEVLSNERSTSPLASLYYLVEMPLVSIFAEMEMMGVKLNTEFLAEMSITLTKRMREIESEVHQIVGEPFNLNSPQQLSHALFERLALKLPGHTKRTATGSISTAAEVLETLRGQHPVVDLMLEYREVAKLKSTYVDALPQQINAQTERIHTSYNQTGSVTGRIASSNPNLQNIPIRTELGRKVRKAFIAADGFSLLSIDYSQVELRIVAHFAQDEAMLAAFRANQDIHTATAAAIYNIPLSEVTKEQRRHAKAINFGLIYGMSAFGLTRSSDLTLAEAEVFVAEYFKRFPGIKAYLYDMRKKAARQGYVETLLGRRRYFPNLKPSSNPNYLSREEREAINAPIQGTAADIIKIAMLNVAEELQQQNLKTSMLLQVHDELVFECPEDELLEAIPILQRIMEQAYQLSVPLLTEARVGKNWGEMKVVEFYH